MSSFAAAIAAPCLIVTLTGTQGGPQSFNGLAGAGTLVRYGDDSNECGTVKLQFDVGRGTTMRLSQLGIGPEQLNAVFFTHLHNDHTEGFTDLIQLRWDLLGPKVDVVCSADVPSPAGVMSCVKFSAHITDAFIQSGEVDLRRSEVKERVAGGSAELINTITFPPKDTAQVAWSAGDLQVVAVRSAHIPGHVSYRVNSPAGSVVIGGDAGNDVPAPPRSSSTSDQVEKLSQGADIIVHSAIHPIMGPDRGSGMSAYAYFRQSSVPDLGSMAKRAGAKHLMLTHLIPPIGADRQYPFKVPGGALTASDYTKAARDGGFTGDIVVGTDLVSLRIPAK